jgi:hypothetical protein
MDIGEKLEEKFFRSQINMDYGPGFILKTA